MINLAIHMRITGLQVTNEDVDSRKEAVATLKATWGKLRNVDEILTKAAEVAEALSGDGTPPPPLGEEVQAAVQTHASAFLHVDRPLEVGIVAAVTAAELVATPANQSGWLIADVWAAALWSALAFQPQLEEAKREGLRTVVLGAARARAIDGAEAARQRSEVADFGEFTVTPGAEQGPENFEKATAATIEALRRNAALDREELDFLWWSQLGRSRLLDRPLASIEEPVRIVAAGIEAASHLRRLPCEVHRDVVLRTLDADPELDLCGLLAAVGDDRAILGRPYVDGVVNRAHNVFPLLNAFATGSTAVNGAKVRRTTGEWGARALLEAGLVRMCSTGPAKL